MKTLVAALAILATAIALPASAENQDCGSETIDVSGTVYLSQDEPGIPLVDSGFWIYAESNGEVGLQRGGTTLAGDVDTCQASSNPDTGLF